MEPIVMTNKCCPKLSLVFWITRVLSYRTYIFKQNPKVHKSTPKYTNVGQHGSI